MKCLVITYGCKQNENDSERIKGVLASMDGEFCDDEKHADIIVFNTCNVREGAANRLYGNIGALKALKQRNPGLIIVVCGCVTAEVDVQQKFKQSYPYVDIVIGTNSLHKLKDMLNEVLQKNMHTQDNSHTITKNKHAAIYALDEDFDIHEGIPQVRDCKFSATVPIMSGCNNFCTYCIVPYVRGRERSREAQNIIDEVTALSNDGCIEVTLLGQNVNSYKCPSTNINFATLLRRVNQVKGIKRIRFISSHPKDFNPEVISAMAECDNICPQLHLPFQSGSDIILNDMNRKYTRTDYINLITMARQAIPGLTITSDCIVGFPTETQADFDQTLDLIKTLKLDMLFTFIYSRRSGTKAAKYAFAMSKDEIKRNFDELVKTQNEISNQINQKMVGNVVEVLVEGVSKKNEAMYSGRTPGGKIVNFKADKLDSVDNAASLIGTLVNTKIISANTFAFIGEQV
ncbi:MAG: tRNA (N6-isopentenyl adenosine(37)-C2)-methylthiotransferase MiaB [Clostridiales bacterium]|jgi:tRNA-2-methylthio-N6-dimethylallyladenosine synthase|nr:tRNA (N6-isopentenyl adenosine(37)-C2)-methylthiotransferase MiaB [Clostridiales bacterium]